MTDAWGCSIHGGTGNTTTASPNFATRAVVSGGAGRVGAHNHDWVAGSLVEDE